MAASIPAPFPAVALGLAACVLVACAGGPAPVADAPAVDTAAQATVAAIPGLHVPSETLLTAGQPSAEAWEALAAQGVTTVVNLRADSEMAGRDPRGEVDAAGMAYHHLPVAAAEDLTRENALRLWSLVEAAPGRVLVHCASANRAGALLALGAHEAGGMSPEAALAFGRAAGLSSPRLDAEVRTRLGLESEPPSE